MFSLSIMRRSKVAITLAVVAGSLIAAGTALALATWKADPSPNSGGHGYTNDLRGVAATSKDNAWAVGSYIKGAVLGPIKRPGSNKGHPWRAMIEHWNGKSWQNQANPHSRGTYLQSVAATSAKNAWAVGFYNTPGPDRTLIEGWDGTAWKTQKSPNPAGSKRDSDLYGVAATSSNNAWAVGSYGNGTAFRTLVEHWNGKSWKTQPSPNPSTESSLSAVAATSPNNAWAVGSYYNGSIYKTLIEHWNGKSWKVQPSPNISGATNNYLESVTAVSPKNAWAVGFDQVGAPDQTLIEHWNGKSWKVQPSVDPGGPSNDNLLIGVAATSRKNAWAVGWFYTGTRAETVVEQWTGTGWYIRPSANPGNKGDALYGVAARSATSAWGVGEQASSVIQRTLIEHGS